MREPEHSRDAVFRFFVEYNGPLALPADDC